MNVGANTSLKRYMVLLRATGKVLRYLPKPVPSEEESDAALGDWYVNRVVVGRNPLLVLISSMSYLPIVIRARDVRSLPARLPDLVDGRLRRLGGVTRDQVEAERAAMAPVRVAKTADRSVVGILVDFGRHLPYHLDTGAVDNTMLQLAEQRLQRIPRSRRYPHRHGLRDGREVPDLKRRS